MRSARLLACALLVVLCIAPQRAHAQALSAGLGFAGGLLGGAYVTTGTYVLKSRATGWTLHSVSDIIAPRLEALPLVVMPIAGAVIGYQSKETLADVGTWGGVGLVGGAIVGVGFGQLIWGGSEGRWAGGTIGSAAGLAIGAVLGALASSTDESAPQETPAFRLSFSLAGPR